MWSSGHYPRISFLWRSITAVLACLIACSLIIAGGAVPPYISSSGQDNSPGPILIQDPAQSQADPHTGCLLTDLGGEYQGSQMVLMYTNSDDLEMSANAQCPRYALSIAKLYLGQYVVEYGTAEEKSQIIRMIATSDDDLATALYTKYPDAIDVIAHEYGLTVTQGSDKWGNSLTSSYDVAQFLRMLLSMGNSRVIQAMESMSPTAADGYPQNYGTTLLPGVQGSKLGWANDYTMHSSASFGHIGDTQYIAVAMVFGSAPDLSTLVASHIAPLLKS